MNLKTSSIQQTQSSNPLTLGAVVALSVCFISAFFLFKIIFQHGDKGKQAKSSPKIPKHLSRPERKEGGLRTIDASELSPEAAAIRRKALKLAKEKRIKEAAKLLEEINLRRDAIDLLEANGYLDEGADILLKMNRPNRAAVLYERNKCLDKAALYFLRAKLLDDAKRCCEDVSQFNFGITTEIAEHFARAGDVSYAVNLLMTINAKDAMIRLVRETKSFSELAIVLDDKKSRNTLLGSLSLFDFEQLLSSMKEDEENLRKRVGMWLNESRKGEWLVPALASLGDNRGLARKIAEQTDSVVIDNFITYFRNTNRDFLQKNRIGIEWTARALHDSGLWMAAAVSYEGLGFAILAGKCWALLGNSPNALHYLRSPQGDKAIHDSYLSALTDLGRTPQSITPLEKSEHDRLARLFFYVDPDTEKRRTVSPF